MIKLIDEGRSEGISGQLQGKLEIYDFGGTFISWVLISFDSRKLWAAQMDTQSGMDICAHDIAHYRNQLFKSTVLSTKLKDFILKKKKEDDKNIKEERVKKRKNLVINDEEESKAISLSDIR